MILFKLWSLLSGYVVITIEGQHVEKFINMAVSRGYLLWDIYCRSQNMVIAKVHVNSFSSLRHIARATGCKIRISGKRGFPFIVNKIRRRKMLPAGAVVFLVSLYILSSFIWSVEVKSNRNLTLLTERQILEAASATGLKRGVLKYKIDTNEIKELIERQFPQIGWAGIEIKGTRAIIEVVEKVLPDAKHTDRHPGNIIAAKDGLIKEILVLVGEAKVVEGETVKKGDILISGVIIKEPQEKEGEERLQDEGTQEDSEISDEPRYVRAKGIVRARVWYEARHKMPLVAFKDKETGKSEGFIMLKIGHQEILLKGSKVISYDHYYTDSSVKKLPSWRNFKTPVELVTTTYHELERHREYYSMVEAKELAERQAIGKIKHQLPSGSKIISQKSNVQSLGEQEIEVRVFVETVEEIGIFVPLKEH